MKAPPTTKKPGKGKTVTVGTKANLERVEVN